MIVVADTSPLNYLVLIGAQDVLEALYESVVVPLSVAVVREWICRPPDWLKVMRALALSIFGESGLDR
jgi:predicted nucleic acid-binding protein